MNKEQHYQNEPSNDFARSTKTGEVAPLSADTVPAGSAHTEGTEEHHDQQAELTAVTDAQRERTVASKPSRATASGEGTSFLHALVGRGMAITVAQELFRTNEQLRRENEVFTEKLQRKRQSARESAKRSRQKRREQDPEGYRAQERQRKRAYRARKKQEADSQAHQHPTTS